MKWTEHNKRVLKELILNIICFILIELMFGLLVFGMVENIEKCPIYVYQESLKK